MSRNWFKKIDWPLFAQTADQEGIEELYRAQKEGRHSELPDGVGTSESEIVEMARVLDDHGHDPGRFLRVLRQDAEEFAVAPEEVYEEDDLHEEPYWPELGFGLTMAELTWLRSACCDVAASADSAADGEYEHSPVERLDELCEFLTCAEEIEIPPSLSRGDE